jgi:hypothetical protein
MTRHCGFSIFVAEVQIKIEIHKSIIQIKMAGNSTGGYAPRYPPAYGRYCKKSVRTYTHTEFLFTHLNLPISPASLVSRF